MDVDATLYPRKEIERGGIAPLTSMFQCAENDRRVTDDWRLEIHDSDGLSMWRGNGEWIWRPLVNIPALHFSSFMDENPKGFGLLQRDQDFDHYLDDGAMYHKRPSLWVEPLEAWSKGQIQLIEIPSPDETFDNTVVFWNPEPPFAPARSAASATACTGEPNRSLLRKWLISFPLGSEPEASPARKTAARRASSRSISKAAVSNNFLGKRKSSPSSAHHAARSSTRRPAGGGWRYVALQLRSPRGWQGTGGPPSFPQGRQGRPERNMDLSVHAAVKFQMAFIARSPAWRSGFAKK